MLFFWTFYSSKIPKRHYHSFHKNNKQQNYFCNIDYNKMLFWASNQHITIISINYVILKTNVIMLKIQL